MADIEQAIKEYINKEFLFDKPEIALHDNLPIVEQGIIDSLGVLRLVVYIENEFGIKVDPTDVLLENFGTINAMKQFITVKLQSESGSS